MTGISAEALHRLLDTITHEAIRLAGATADPIDLTDEEVRRALFDFATTYNLDIQDTATLYRIAASEAVEWRPDSTWHSTDVCTAIEAAVRIIDSRPKPAPPVYENPF